MSATFTIETIDDDIVELREELVVTLTAHTVVDGETEPGPNRSGRREP